MGSYLTTFSYPPVNGKPHPFTGPAWVEDFDYGYPYRNNITYPQYGQLAVTPAEFEYSTTEHTSLGIKKSTSYRRRDFTLQKFDPGTEPANFDRGYNAKAPYALSNYYMLWPLMGWGETQTMAVTVKTDNYCAMVWYHSFDGHYADKLTVFLNGKQWGAITGSASHGWTGDQIWLPPGLNRITWVFETARNPATKSTTALPAGVTSISSTPPALQRRLRFAYLFCTKVTTLPVAKTDYANIQLTGTFTGIGTIKRSSGKVFMGINGFLGNQQKTGMCFMTGDFEFITNDIAMAHDSGFVELQGDGELTVTSSVKADHAADDGGWHLSSDGHIRVETPIDHQQGILVRPLQIVVPTMRTPIFIQGRPKHPRWFDITSSTTSTNSTYAVTDPVTPGQVDKQLPVFPTYRWVAADIAGSDGDLVSQWNTRTPGGPSWYSSGVFQPSIFQHTHFSPSGDFGQGNYVTYSRALHFDNEMAEHMWMSMPSGDRRNAYTWQLVLIQGPATSDRWNNFLDGGTGNATPQFDVALRNGQHNPIAGEPVNARCRILKTNSTYIVQTATTRVPSGSWDLMFYGPEITTRPVVITAVVGGSGASTLSINTTTYNHYQSYHQTSTTPVGWLLGRACGFADQFNSSVMSMMELNYWNRPLSKTEWTKNVQYLSSLYQFNKYR